MTFGAIPGAVFDSITKSRVKLDEDASGTGRLPGIEEDSDDDLIEEEERQELAKAGLNDHSSSAGESRASEGTKSTAEGSLDSREDDGALFQMLMDNLGPRQQDGLEGPKMLCCSAFMEGYCSKTTCPKAHPGIRDSAEVSQVRLPGRVKKVSYVTSALCTMGMPSQVVPGWKLSPISHLYPP